jgi:hypothetical protein
LATQLDARAEVTAIVSAGPAALAPGRQEVDELLIGLAGEVEVSLWPPGDDVPTGGAEPPVWQGGVRRSEGLLVPAGWVFSVGTGAPAAWASIRLQRRRHSDVASYVAERLAGCLPFRLDLPAAGPTGGTSNPVDWSSPEVDDLVRRASAQAPGWWRATLPTVPSAPPTDVLRALSGPATPVRWNIPGGLSPVLELPPSAPAPAAGAVALAGGGLLLTVPDDFAVDGLVVDADALDSAPDGWRRELVLAGVLSPCAVEVGPVRGQAR